MAVALQYELTCSSYTISPQSYNKINVEKTLNNIEWTVHDTMINNGAIIINNKLYTLINGYVSYIDLNTFETKVIDNTNMYPTNINFIYNPYKQRLNLLIDGQSGIQYDIDNNISLNNIYLNITGGVLNKILVSNSNNQYQIIIDGNNDYSLYDMYDLTEIYYFDSSKFKILYSFMLNGSIYIIDGNEGYLRGYKFDINNHTLLLINEFTNLPLTRYMPLFQNIGKYVYYIYSIQNITKFNIDNTTDTTVIPLYLVNYTISIPKIYNSNKSIYILWSTKNDHSPVILSIDINNNIKTYNLNKNQVAFYSGLANIHIHLAHNIYIFNDILYVTLTNIGSGNNLGELYPYIRQFDKDLNVLYDIGLCDELYDITDDGKKLYILTQSTSGMSSEAIS